MTNTITTADLAASLETTPRTLRKFLRSDASGIAPVGKGARYALPATKRDISKFAKNFTAWSEAQDEARKVRQDAAEAAKVEAPAEVTDEVNDDDLELEGPSDEELAAIDEA